MLHVVQYMLFLSERPNFFLHPIFELQNGLLPKQWHRMSPLLNFLGGLARTHGAPHQVSHESYTSTRVLKDFNSWIMPMILVLRMSGQSPLKK